MAQRANKAKAAQERKDLETSKTVIIALMSRVDGRRWVWLQLSFAMVFLADVELDPQKLAWRAGMRNGGLKLMSEVMAHSPAGFVEMMKENSAKALEPLEETEEDEDARSSDS